MNLFSLDKRVDGVYFNAMSLTIVKKDKLTKDLEELFPGDTCHDIRVAIYEFTVEKIRALINTDTCILLQLPQGKPDPQAFCTVNTLACDTRPRVKQKKYEGTNCWFYALKMIGFRIGKNPSQALGNKREIEKIFSARRKQIVQLAKFLPFNMFQLFNQTDLKMTKKEDVRLLLALPKMITAKSLLPFYKDFLQKKFDDFHSYLIDRALTLTANASLPIFKKIGKTPEKMLDEAYKENPNGVFLQLSALQDDLPADFKWENLKSEAQAFLIDRFAMRAMAEAYGLKKSQWKKEGAIEELIHALKNEGPLVIGAKMPRSDAWVKSSLTLAGRNIYQIKASSLNEEKSINFQVGHAFTLVGACKATPQDLVFFVDPSDGSDPQDPSIQKIYVISLNFLKNNVIAIDAISLRYLPNAHTFYAWAPSHFKL